MNRTVAFLFGEHQAKKPDSFGASQSPHAPVVRGFRIEPKEQGTEKRVGGVGHGKRLKKPGALVDMLFWESRTGLRV